MKYRCRLIISSVILVMAFFAFSALLAQDQDIDKVLEKGIEQYMMENFEAAARTAEDALSLNPEHQQAKELLIRSLKRAAMTYYDQEKFKEALTYLEKASSFDPSDEEIKTILSDTKAKMDALEKEIREAKAAREKMARERSEWEKNLKKRKSSDVSEWDRELSIRKKRDIRNLEEELRLKRENMEEDLRKQIGITEKEWQVRMETFKKTLFWAAVSFFIMLSIFVAGIFIWGKRLSQIRDITQYQIKEEVLGLISQKNEENWAPLKEDEGKILSQTEKILNLENKTVKIIEEKLVLMDEKLTRLLEDRIKALSDGQSGLLKEKMEDMMDVLRENLEANLIDAQTRVLDLLEKTSLLSVPELVEQWKKEQFSNENVQITPSTHVLRLTQRAKELFRASPDRALELLRELSKDRDRWVRASVVSALNEVDEPEGVDILLELLKDNVQIVRTSAYQALQRKVARGRESISEELAKKILEALRKSNFR